MVSTHLQAATGSPEGSESASVKIAVRDLAFYYGKKQALTNINMQIGDRQITALIGPSGCGKSTFLRTLNRMNDTIAGTRTEGSVLIDGEDIYQRDTDCVELRKSIGMVFQRPTPFMMSIFDNVAYGPRVNRLARGKALAELVEQSLRQAALWDEVKDTLRKPGGSLSGGQQQRMCIARVLAVSPEIILLDEPCSALDPISTAKIEDLLLTLKQDYTIVIVTHNLQQASRVSDHTGFFLNGELVEFGPTTQIFTRPVDPQTEAYITGHFG